ncbi:MAG: sulfite exporter TauE/SafE family protein, partial [Pseudomonadota bacterium]|nr:sulfite exporter TauE/SafE family protein [Pseudomonadota bacterium]
GSLLLPVAVYLQALKLDKDTLVQAVGLSLFIGTVIWAISLYSEGGMTADIWILPAIAVPPILVSMVISQ